ncbi:MAG TPA: hypothetical protein VJ884_01095 [Salinibacter sp.]|nr:hypothetical protein [Salinibacter sp.]
MSIFSRPVFTGSVLLVLALTSGVALPPSVSAQQIAISTSGLYSSGDYIFTESTDLFVWSNSVSVTEGRFQIGISVPLVAQTTPWVTYGGIGPTPSGGPQHGAVGGPGHGAQRGRRTPIALPDTGSYRTTGVGDPQVHVSYDLRSQADTSQLRVQLLGAVKPPLANADAGFSTGAWDGGLGLSISRALTPWFALAEGTYWWLGDLDELTLKNGVSYSVGVGRTLYRGRWGLLASISGTTSIIEDVDPPAARNGGINYSTGYWGLSTTFSSGLTEGAADWSVGVGAMATLRN